LDIRGVYRFSSLMKQKIKAKNKKKLLRHIRRNFFFKFFVYFYVTKCLRSKKKKLKSPEAPVDDTVTAQPCSTNH
jgi:hypothetical protein